MRKGARVIYGTLAIDTLITPHGSADCVLGGSGTYAALAARFLAPNACLYGVIGTDFPSSFRDDLLQVGVSLDGVEQCEGSTFAWTGEYELDMNNRRTVEVLEGVQDDWAPHLPQFMAQPSMLLACNVRPDLQWAVIEQCPDDCIIIADFMKSWLEREPAYVAQILARATIALMNDEEAKFFAQSDSLEHAARAILAAGSRFALIKQGSEGSHLYTFVGGELLHHHCAADQIDDACDPTGAGDSYMGALGAYLMAHIAPNENRPISWDDLVCAMPYASRLAAQACRSFGPRALLSFR